ncbi:MAG TPA: hypothetical protein VNU72_09935 [Puia sp.]|nr:hypothetical protein [Puia sp.]
MKKLTLLTVLALAAGVFHANAQSLRNTAWKTYITTASDSMTLHIGTDSSWVTTGGGDVVVRSLCHVSKDTITLDDFDGQYMCPNQKGVYTYTLKDDKLVLNLVNDGCDGRATGINGVAWIRISKNP